MKTISDKTYEALKNKIEELEKLEREEHSVTVVWLRDGTKEMHDKLWKAKQSIDAKFTQDVLFVPFGRYIVVEYYFKPMALIVLAKDG